MKQDNSRPLQTEDFPPEATHWVDDPVTGAALPVVPWRGEVCRICERRNPVGFRVADEHWEAVTLGRYDVLCPACFDELAEWVGVQYRIQETFCVAWQEWQEWYGEEGE